MLEASRFLVTGESCQQAPLARWHFGSMLGYMYVSTAVLLSLTLKEH